jgi:Coenzyme PQQ synthesis protein D (PqqD)
VSHGRGSRECAAPRRRVDVEWIELDGEAVLYDPRSMTLHRLNAAAAAVWAACDGSATTEEISRALEGVYDGPSAAIEGDVRGLIARFRRLNLLEQSPAAADAFR